MSCLTDRGCVCSDNLSLLMCRRCFCTLSYTPSQPCLRRGINVDRCGHQLGRCQHDHAVAATKVALHPHPHQDGMRRATSALRSAVAAGFRCSVVCCRSQSGRASVYPLVFAPNEPLQSVASCRVRVRTVEVASFKWDQLSSVRSHPLARSKASTAGHSLRPVA